MTSEFSCLLDNYFFSLNALILGTEECICRLDI